MPMVSTIQDNMEQELLTRPHRLLILLRRKNHQQLLRFNELAWDFLHIFPSFGYMNCCGFPFIPISIVFPILVSIVFFITFWVFFIVSNPNYNCFDMLKGPRPYKNFEPLVLSNAHNGIFYVAVSLCCAAIKAYHWQLLIFADPEAEVIALSPRTLLATNRFLCEICGKGFQRDQNLQLHRRGHNLPWKLRQRSTKEPRKRVYVCPEKSCVHHNPARALGDLTGIKKHFCRKHGEKKWKCEKCSKRYAVQSDWKAHSKTCGTREYRCDCGILFSRRDSFITHRAFCDALAEETARVAAASNINNMAPISDANYLSIGGSMRSNMLQNFSSNIKPHISNCEANDQARPGLSLWMGHGIQNGEPFSSTTSLSDIHQIGPVGAGTLYGDLFTASCSNAQQLGTQLSWLCGNKLWPTGTCELSGTPIPTTTMMEVDSSQSLLTSIPSLFSTQRQHHRAPVSDMSATALLQKATQIGVTSTIPFVGSFEPSKCQDARIEDASLKYDGLVINSNQLSNLENIVNGFTASNDMFAERHRSSLKDDLEGGGETRDFLGVGVQTLCPSLINGWI
ncbi:putative Zinc finger protein MAGPIE [Cocos nucifera]|nr:putative Zinc finger protein MAGPIE [Cocos nucifera]